MRLSELSAYCLYNFIDKEEGTHVGRFFYFMNNRMRTDLRLKKIRIISHKKWNTVTNCYSVFRIDLLEKW